MYVLIQTAVGGYTLGETSLTTQTYTSAVTQTASYNLFTAPSADDAHVHWLCVLIANLKQAARISSYELILNSKRSQDLFWSGCKCLTNLELKNYTTKRMYWVSLNNYCFLGFFFFSFFFSSFLWTVQLIITNHCSSVLNIHVVRFDFYNNTCASRKVLS